MKKLNNIYIGVLGSMLLLSACGKQLDLKPYQQIEQSTAILTAKDVQITLVGGYNRMGLSDLFGGGVFLYPDLMATQTAINWHGTFQTLTDMTNQAITIDNSDVDLSWYDGYQVINQTNNVLANLSKVAAADQGRTQGEAEFLRGLTYFELTRLFGRAWNDGDPTVNLAVPIVLTPTKSLTPASKVSRATVAKVYEQAIADLTDAESKLPESNDFYANKYSAAAILARLYLQKQDYANALKEANTVISSKAFQLNADYLKEFPTGSAHVDNTTEDIFAIQVTAQAGTNAMNTFYASSDFGGRGDIDINQSFLDATFENGDARLGIYNQDSGGVLKCDKFDNIYGNVHVIRLAEIYLIRAEANLRLNSTTGDLPVNDINIIRERAQVSDIPVGTPTATLLADVLKERVRELTFEGGFFLYDAKRLSTTSSPIIIGANNAFSPKVVFPIPQVELNANPNLVQNPTYGTH